MPQKKIKVGVLAGGFSNERQISLLTGKQIVQALPKEKYQAVLIEISKDEKKAIPELIKKLSRQKMDVAFIGLHGRFGEDGKIQAILDVLQIPYTGSGVLASALGMDKVKCMEVLEKNKILLPKFITFINPKINFSKVDEKIKKTFGYPCVVKPNESGSSVGVTIVKNSKQLMPAIKKAFQEDKIVIAQKYIQGRELSAGVMGNSNQERILTFPVIEIVTPGAEFFDYKQKYFSQTVREICPTNIPQKIENKIRETAKKIHQILGCDGLTRSDFILTKDNKFYFLEINTLPGQTQTSLCPKEAKAAGIAFPDFLDQQIQLALRK